MAVLNLTVRLPHAANVSVDEATQLRHAYQCFVQRLNGPCSLAQVSGLESHQNMMCAWCGILECVTDFAEPEEASGE